jgi:hypothetical protein
MGEVENPFNELMAGAVATHELFMSYVNAGFKRHEALEIIKTMMAETIRQGDSNNSNEE